MATFTIDLNGGDVETPDNELYYKIYGSANGYATPILTTGTADADQNVSVAAGVATITNVNLGTETSFKAGVVDGDGNESVLSDVYVVTTGTEIYTEASAVCIANEANGIGAWNLRNLVVRTSDATEHQSGLYSLKVEAGQSSASRTEYSFSVVLGKSYNVSFYTKKGAGIDQKAVVFDGSVDSAPFSISDVDWTKHTTNFIAPITGTGRIRIYASYDVGVIGDVVYLDTVSILES